MVGVIKVSGIGHCIVIVVIEFTYSRHCLAQHQQRYRPDIPSTPRPTPISITVTATVTVIPAIPFSDDDIRSHYISGRGAGRNGSGGMLCLGFVFLCQIYIKERFLYNIRGGISNSGSWDSKGACLGLENISPSDPHPRHAADSCTAACMDAPGLEALWTWRYYDQGQ